MDGKQIAILFTALGVIIGTTILTPIEVKRLNNTVKTEAAQIKTSCIKKE